MNEHSVAERLSGVPLSCWSTTWKMVVRSTKRLRAAWFIVEACADPQDAFEEARDNPPDVTVTRVGLRLRERRDGLHIYAPPQGGRAHARRRRHRHHRRHRGGLPSRRSGSCCDGILELPD